MIETIIKKLLEDAAVKGMVGNNIHVLRVPQNESYPAIVLTNVSKIPGQTKSAQLPLDRNRLQVDCYDPSPIRANALSQIVRASLHGYKTADISRVYLDNEHHDYIDESALAVNRADYIVITNN